MGYLTGNEITVDAILTKKGRELLAMGRSAFNVTQFAVADDEIDYGLYDTAHPLGTAYYGSAIERMPVVEASPDETQNLRYKLVTLGRGAANIPTIQVGIAAINLTYSSTANPTSPTIKPTTSDGTLNGPTFGYTAILYDSEAAVLSGTPVPGTSTVPVFFGDVPLTNAVVLRGLDFTLRPRNVTKKTETQLVIIGNETGATVTIPVTIYPATTT
jgi:hypothetical protein